MFNNLKGASAGGDARRLGAFAGTEQPVAVICEIRDAAATMLRNKGYLAAVQVPTQRIENGVVRIEMLYARVTTIRARGQTGGAEAKLAGYLDKLTEDEYFDRNRAERYLLLARDLPGYNVQLTLKPAGTGPGELIGEVSVLRRPYSLDAPSRISPRRKPAAGAGSCAARLFGLTGLGDVTSLSLLFDRRLQGAADPAGRRTASGPGSEGLTIDGQFTYAWTKPDIDAQRRDPDIKAGPCSRRSARAIRSIRTPVVQPVGRRSGSISSTRRSISSAR